MGSRMTAVLAPRGGWCGRVGGGGYSAFNRRQPDAPQAWTSSCVFEEFGDVKDPNRCGNHGRTWKSMIAPPMLGSQRIICGNIGFGDLFAFWEARIGDGDKTIANFLFADFAFHEPEKLLL